MDFLTNIDLGALILICGVLCVGGAVILIGLQVLTGAFELLAGGAEIFVDILTGGPASWCGCLVFLAGCLICIGIALAIASVLSTCGTPDAVNFCRIFG